MEDKAGPEVVTREQLEAVASLGAAKASDPPPKPPPPPHGAGAGAGKGFDIRAVLRDQGIGFVEKPKSYGIVLLLDRCLTSTEHEDGACILEFPSGALSYKCQHASCQGKGWEDAKEALGLRRRNATDGAAGGAGTQADPDRFRILWDEEVENLPPPDWLVQGYVVEKAIAVLYGPPGAGKSFLALDLALCVSQGRDWHGCPTRKSPVVYGASEGASGLGLRIKAWKRHHGMAGRMGTGFVFQPCNFLDAKDVEAFLERLRSLPEKPALVVVDTLAWAMAGGDENAVKDLMLVLQAARRIRDEFDATVLIVHHTGKSGEAERGSSALRAGADTMLKLTVDGSRIKLEVDKQKDAPPPKPRLFKLEPVAVGGQKGQGDDAEIDLATSCVLIEAAAAPGAEEDPLGLHLTLNQRKGLVALRDAPDPWTSTGQWACLSELKRSSFNLVRKHLVERGYVERKDKGNGVLNRITDEGRAALEPQPNPFTSRAKDAAHAGTD